jgi:hypothetical protein
VCNTGAANTAITVASTRGDIIYENCRRRREPEVAAMPDAHSGDHVPPGEFRRVRRRVHAAFGGVTMAAALD